MGPKRKKEMSGEEPKSAYELAMERLRKKDQESGASEAPVSEERKKAVAEIRRLYEARLAEVEILHRSNLAKTQDPEARSALEEGYRRDRERLLGEREGKIEKARGT